MTTPYSITISMPQSTVDGLTAQQFSLYGFKAVQTTTGGGAPLVWFKTQSFGLSTVVNWAESYQAFTATSTAIHSGSVTATNAYDIDLGQTLEVNSPTGTGTVNTLTGVPLAISILNNTTTLQTCGISQLQGSVSVPLCAFPLNGGNLDVIAPIEKVVLMFATNQVNTGSVIFQAFSPGVLLDLTADPALNVSYDINNGWDWGGGPEGRSIKAQANLVPFVIQSASASSLMARRIAGAV